VRYAYNEAGGVVNGVIFFFEKGDEKIALRTENIDSDGYLGVRFTVGTVSENELLKRYLVFLRAVCPALAPLTREIDSRVFGTVQ